MILSLLLLMGTALPTEYVCVGFTGPQCDRSYPLTQCGTRDALRETVASATIVMGHSIVYIDPRHFCNREDEAEFISEPSNFIQRPWKRRNIDLFAPNFAPLSLSDLMEIRPILDLRHQTGNVWIHGLHFCALSLRERRLRW